MQNLSRIFCFLVLISLPSVSTHALTVGAYWAFQVEQDVGPPGAGYSSFGSFSQSVNVTNWPNETPSFSYNGSIKTTFNNYGSDYTVYDGSIWVGGSRLDGIRLPHHRRATVFKLP